MFSSAEYWVGSNQVWRAEHFGENSPIHLNTSGSLPSIVMLSETNPGQATIVTNRLLNYLAETPVSTDCGKQISFNVSIGMTVAGNFATLRSDIIKTANKALYLAKKRGRNNIVLL